MADQTQNQLIVGSANNLPLPSSSLDLILNIESSHLYDSTPQFLAEVFRVLKPGGYFCWADIRFKEEVPVVLEEATATGLKLVEYENITSGVLNGIEYTSRQYDKLFDKVRTTILFLLFKFSRLHGFSDCSKNRFEQLIALPELGPTIVYSDVRNCMPQRVGQNQQMIKIFKLLSN